jgi:hypothetical protein
LRWALVFRLWLRLSAFRSRWCSDTFTARLLLLRWSRRTLSLRCACWTFDAWLFHATRLFYTLLTAFLLALFLLDSTCFAL